MPAVIRKTAISCAVVMCCVALAGVANADYIDFWLSWPGLATAGRFYAAEQNDDTWLITGAEGRFNGQLIAGVDPTGTNPFFWYNNIFHGADSGAAFDLWGVVFAVPGVGEVNLCYSPGCHDAGYTAIVWNNGYTFLDATQYGFGAPVPAAPGGSAIPEPSSMALLGAGLVGAYFAFRRRKASGGSVLIWKRT